ncbi:hypothetical protein BASA61_000738 [Batrachochytrium salamandrivorans]|nr:hypothetical protein BASA62_004543 [Batrachochytrium salamandrivorans]KAH6571570.1 hypothetical protein BASA60_007094 [Batrachochytrium salamandrivorans]KAH6602803.1 hypothetical protein BASA61_000738 [Batrachochytrium salamandrivorans]KAH9267564.1 hypothetical protein BASA84_000616 [Batrachochytrium salamandrivorans]KAH9276969.1 hypothetical protein BASA83_000484 [Batrachochytrium salamandrivorans]
MEFVQKQAEVERLAEDILSERHLRIEYDRRRQELQQVLRLFREGKALAAENKPWMFSGGMFMKFPRDDAQQMLREDLAKINLEIDKCNDKIRQWTIELEQTERGADSARIKGLELKGVSQSEMGALSQLTKRS